MSWAVNITMRYLVPVLCTGINIALGVLNVRHKHTGASLINFACAGVIVGINIAGELARRKRELAMQAVRHMTEHPECLARAIQMSVDPQAMQIAQQNLDMVAKAVGATKTSDCREGCCLTYEMKMGDSLFVVSYGSVEERRNGGARSRTCLQDQQSLPGPEHIAAALLLLRHNPKLFECWKEDPGQMYGC